MKKAIKKIQIFRHLIQLAFLFLSPGLFILAFSETKTIYQMIAKGNFNFIQAFPSLIEFITAIIITIILGRFFCGWICAFGTYNDLLHLLSKNVFKVTFKVNEKVDAVLKYLKYVILLSLIVLVWTMGSISLENTSPWDAFAQITNFPGVLSDYTIGCILLLLITIGAFFIERFFCRYLCPLGAVFSIVSRLGILKIKKSTTKCGKCRLCTNNCSMALPLYKVESVCGGECINCLQCIDACPRKNTQVNILGENINPELASSLAITAMVGLYSVNNVAGLILTQSGLTTVNNTSISANINSTSQKYTDGTYTGTGTGFRGGATKISVIIQNSKIATIETLSNEDTPNFYQRAESVITNEIISSQSTTVDTVSGATYSSRGIISAVEDALLKQPSTILSTSTVSSSTPVTNNNASISIENPTIVPSNAPNSNSNSTTTKLSPTTTNSNPITAKSKSVNTNSSKSISSNTAVNSNINNSNNSVSSIYKDGTYTGTGIGFRGGTTKISVAIKNNKIMNIETVSNQDSPMFYESAAIVLTSKIISAQSISVDTVSGATYSSNGIINAVKNALSRAKS